MKYKKGGQAVAGVWFVAIAIYFIFFILGVYSAENIANGTSNTTLTNSDIDSINFNNIIGTTICENPRYYYNPDTAEESIYNNAQNDRLFCEESVGIFSQTSCESIAGCTWENVTSGWWIFSSTDDATCMGDINASAYGIDVNDGFIGRPRVAPHNNTGVWATYTPFSDASVCTHPNVENNKTLCDLFSCSWTTISAETGFNSAGDIYSTIGDIFTFRYDFGLSNNGVKFFLNFFFVVLPLLILIISIYFMLPVIH